MEVRNEKMPLRAAGGGRLIKTLGIGKRRRAVAVITSTQVSNRANEMPRFKVVTPEGASFTTAGRSYGFENEGLDPIDTEIIEAPTNEDEFIAAARTATPSTPGAPDLEETTNGRHVDAWSEKADVDNFHRLPIRQHEGIVRARASRHAPQKRARPP
jgi:hypothetical protein